MREWSEGEQDCVVGTGGDIWREERLLLQSAMVT